MARKRINIKKLDISKMVPDNEYGWGDYKNFTYKLYETDSPKMQTIRWLRVSYLIDKKTGKNIKEESRYAWSTRRKKYLCINGEYEGQYKTIEQGKDNYKFYSCYNAPHDELRRVLIDVDSVAKRLGLEW